MVELGEPVPYMERTRQYYRALGYTKDYVWARFDEVPFAKLRKALPQARIALITTANPPDYDGVRRLWCGSTGSPPSMLHTADLAWDKESTHTDDRECFLPVETASTLAAEGAFAGLARRFHGVPTDYSQRKISQEVAPQVLERLREDDADAAVFCPL
jgi:D-proline reductase (dithiol) PrdB